jgi:hypothetical protein
MYICGMGRRILFILFITVVTMPVTVELILRGIYPFFYWMVTGITLDFVDNSFFVRLCIKLFPKGI